MSQLPSLDLDLTSALLAELFRARDSLRRAESSPDCTEEERFVASAIEVLLLALVRHEEEMSGLSTARPANGGLGDRVTNLLRAYRIIQEQGRPADAPLTSCRERIRQRRAG